LSIIVRYYGKPVALVIMNEEWQAAQAVNKIKVTYKLLLVMNSVADSLSAGVCMIHPGWSF
jgi:CO/xanthine dehydrogenase Mo-binding subunit